MDFYNHERFHSVLIYDKLMNVHRKGVEKVFKQSDRGWNINSQEFVLTFGGSIYFI